MPLAVSATERIDPHAKLGAKAPVAPGKVFSPIIGPSYSDFYDPSTDMQKMSYNGPQGSQGFKTFEEQSRTTAGSDEAADSFTSTAFSFETMFDEGHRTMQDESSTYHKQPQAGKAAPNRSENGMRTSGAAPRSNDDSYDEIFQWASKYVEVDEQGGNAEQRNDAMASHVAAPPAHLSTSQDRDLMYVFDKYICNKVEDHGVTIMLHDVPYRFQVDPDVIKMINTVGNIDAVDYIYLPMAVDRPTALQFRNKGYLFIHFWDPVAAQSFVNGIYNYKVPVDHCNYDDERPRAHGKGIFAVMAKFQGLSLNLHNLLDIHSKKWRPKNGCAYVRTDSGLACVRLLALRNLAKQYVQLCYKTGGSFGVPLYASVVGSDAA
jgi:hypothetical protein